MSAGNPTNADSLPIPLIVLGAVAFVLMAAGAAGFLARRTRMREDAARLGGGGTAAAGRPAAQETVAEQEIPANGPCKSIRPAGALPSWSLLRGAGTTQLFLGGTWRLRRHQQ